MRRNRKTSKRMSRLSMHTMHIGAVLVTMFMVGIMDLLASSRCEQLTKAVNEGEANLKARVEELECAEARWDAMRTGDNLDRALMRWGLAMRINSQNQTIRMNPAGGVEPGQSSVALARVRSQNAMSAQLKPSAAAARQRPAAGRRR